LASSGGLKAGVYPERFEALSRDGLNDVAKGSNRLRQSIEVVIADLIARRIAGLDIGALQQFEAAAVDPRSARPSLNQTRFAVFGK
jgi:hypothetical protein